MTPTDQLTTETRPGAIQGAAPTGALLSVIADTLAPAGTGRPGRPAGHPRPIPTADAVPARPGGPAPWWYGLVVLVQAAATMALGLWRAGSTPLDPYYQAAVRSMAASWHNLLFGAFDPAGTLSVDKLPLAFWPQAVLVRAAGFHPWALVLPQVLEAGATVAVLASAVRRAAGWRAGLLAGGLLAVAPAAVLSARGNVPDTLMVLLLVLAADQAARAVTRPRRWGPVLAAGVLLGAAFEAKMAEALLAAPALALALLASGDRRLRLRQVAIATAAAAVVGCAWMAAVSLVPSHQRPFVDGTGNDSPWTQVLVYNGTARFGGTAASSEEVSSWIRVAGSSPGAAAVAHSAATEPAGPLRLVSGPAAPVTGWLLPPAAAAGTAGLLLRRRRRGDPVRAALLLWTGWAGAFWLAFSTGTSFLPYYAGALAPAVAALCGIGTAALWRWRHQASWRALAAVLAAATAAWAAWVLPGSGAGLSAGAAAAVTAALAACGAAALGLAVVTGRSARPGSAHRWHRAPGLVVALLALSLAIGPATASVTAAQQRLGPFDAPLEPPAMADLTHVLPRLPALLAPVVRLLRQVEPPGTYLVATDTTMVAAGFIAATGDEALPIGGATGSAPVPSVATLRRLVAEGRIRVVVGTPSADPRMAWVAAHCARLPVPIALPGSSLTRTLLASVAVYACSPAGAGAGAAPGGP